MQPLESAIEFFTSLNNEGIQYCHWKSNEHLLEGLAGETDLDVLVDYTFNTQATRILRKLDYHKMISQFGSRYPNVEDWIGYDNGTGKLIHIHLHYIVITGHSGLKEYSLPWSSLCLKSRIMHSDYPVYVSDPNLEIITLATRIGLKLKFKEWIKAKRGIYKFSNDDLKEFGYLKAIIDWDKVRSLLDLYFEKDCDRMLMLIKSNEYTSSWIIQLNKILRKYGKQWSRIRYPINQLFRAFFSFILPFRYALIKYLGFNIITRKTFSEQKGLLITFVGQDGAGKSTVTKDILRWLTWKVDARQYYLGSGDNYKSINKALVSRFSKAKSLIGRTIRIVASITDLKRLAKRSYKTLLSAKKYVYKGGIALFDRYPQIQFRGINDGPKIRSILEKKSVSGLIRKYIEHSASVEERYLSLASAIIPDIVFKLMLPPEESIRRKPEESIEVVIEKNSIIEKLEFAGASLHIIDATQDYEKEQIEIRSIIWNKLNNNNI